MGAPPTGQDMSPAQLGVQACKRSAHAGAVLVALFALFLRPAPLDREWQQLELLFAALVLVPLGLLLCKPTTETSRRAWTLLLGLQPLAGVSLLCSFLFEPGGAAFLLALPWFATSATAGFLALARLRRRPPRLTSLPGATSDLGLLCLALAGLWILASRRSQLPLDLDGEGLQLASLELLWLGFLLPFLGGMAADERPSRSDPLLLTGLVLGALSVAVSQLVAFLPARPFGAHGSILLWAGQVASLIVLLFHVRLATERRLPVPARLLWGASAVLLAVAGSLPLLTSVAPLLFQLEVQLSLGRTLSLVGAGFLGTLAWGARSSAPVA